MLSSGNSVVSGLTFKSLICFEFDFYVGCEVAVWFDYFRGAVQFPQHQFLERPSFLQCTFFAPLS